MKLTVLGNSGPYEAVGGACSGYLIEDDDARLLLDCGNGVLSNLQRFCTFEQLDAILLSHLHSDHMSDMMVLKYAISIKNKNGSMNKIIPVYAPSAPEEEYARLNVPDAYRLSTITEELVLDIKGLKISFKQMKHSVQSFAICIEKAGKKFVYSGDSAWNEELVDFAGDADMLLIDTGLQEKDKKDGNVAHFTSVEAGIVGSKARVDRLMLTHFWPEYDLSVSLQEAKQNYQAAELSKLLETYQI